MAIEKQSHSIDPLAAALEPVAERELNRHLSVAKNWYPHEFIPWSEGRNFAAQGGEDWSPEQSSLSEAAKAALEVGLATEENLPSYHRELAGGVGLDGAWGQWVHRWTAEEDRHSIAIRDYLVVTRGLDPVDMEDRRMVHMQHGFEGKNKHGMPKTVAEALVYVTFQELATRISHRNTGKACGHPLGEKMLARISMDENLHMLFYRNVTGAAFDEQPDTLMRATADELGHFHMPGMNLPGFNQKAKIIAHAGIYDLTQHVQEVIEPVIKNWNIRSRTDLKGDGDKARHELLEGTLPRLSRLAALLAERRDEIKDAESKQSI